MPTIVDVSSAEAIIADEEFIRANDADSQDIWQTFSCHDLCSITVTDEFEILIDWTLLSVILGFSGLNNFRLLTLELDLMYYQ